MDDAITVEIAAGNLDAAVADGNDNRKSVRLAEVEHGFANDTGTVRINSFPSFSDDR